ncbi:membrane protein [Burkholderia paludis]|uniref:Membrane protein n=1 Tax=Burkholderia paludis TaxID=1506587 RepID=A0A6J5D7H1_9BURK|nr:hypothetical protein LMG30113_00886 [Burkholderia paludis]VWB19225.1 membrane protein [Burkholderia paludis]
MHWKAGAIGSSAWSRSDTAFMLDPDARVVFARRETVRNGDRSLLRLPRSLAPTSPVRVRHGLAFVSGETSFYVMRLLLGAEQDEGVTAHGGRAFGAALRDPQIWLAIFVYFCHQLTIYTVIFFLPGIIGASGRVSPFAVGLLTALPWLAAALGVATLPRFARESHHSRRMPCAGLIVMAAGMAGAAHASPVAGLACVCVCVCVAASMFFVVQSIAFTFPASRLAGNALAGGLGLVNTCGLLGGFVGPTVVGALGPTTGNAKNGLALLAAALVVAAFASLALRHGHEQVGVRSHDSQPA